MYRLRTRWAISVVLRTPNPYTGDTVHENAMSVVDLSQSLSASMPVYPGTEPPRFVEATTIEREGFAEKLISLYSHTGTHIDAPGHILAGAPTLDRLPVDQFVGPACVVDVSNTRDGRIDVELLESQAPRMAGADFVLLMSGWSRRWGSREYFEGFPLLTEAGAGWLASRGLKGIGVDMISVDSVGSRDFAIHKILFRAGMVIVENLCRLEELGPETFLFSCMPLKILDADGSPVRACAIQLRR